ncbi:PGPGW domain-containing protein [Arthrobacter sp. RIT-PI-e]|uniref:PGPGW domain-containing protein n=1 Tax=Arthrobacter sp. RIT-PI-e TaxID=1681197 RepID=UPI0009E608DD|nr:PGPGW domain-containing protein [Arthrobacter sp. RIT-PI-e]
MAADRRTPARGVEGSSTAGHAQSGGIRRAAGLVSGWLLVLLGLAALVLPGPGLLTLVAGLAVLAPHYAWARRWLQPVRRRAFVAAARGVQSRWSIALSLGGVVVLVLLGILWIAQPAAPGWWPIDGRWWLPGGWSVGSSLILSGVFAATFIVYSIRRFRTRT